MGDRMEVTVASFWGLDIQYWTKYANALASLWNPLLFSPPTRESPIKFFEKEFANPKGTEKGGRGERGCERLFCIRYVEEEADAEPVLEGFFHIHFRIELREREQIETAAFFQNAAAF